MAEGEVGSGGSRDAGVGRCGVYRSLGGRCACIHPKEGERVHEEPGNGVKEEVDRRPPPLLFPKVFSTISNSRPQGRRGTNLTHITTCSGPKLDGG